MLTEKVRNEMGKTTSLKVKKNGKTIMMLDPQVVTAKMASLKSLDKTKINSGIFSKLTCLFGKSSKE